MVRQILINMDLSEIEMHFLHQFEESDEELFQLELDVKLYFSPEALNLKTIKKTVKSTIKKLYKKKLIKLYECHFQEVKANYFINIKIIELPDAMVDLVLEDEKSWDKDHLFRQKIRFYFHPTRKGIEYLNTYFKNLEL